MDSHESAQLFDRRAVGIAPRLRAVKVHGCAPSEWLFGGGRTSIGVAVQVAMAWVGTLAPPLRGGGSVSAPGACMA